MFLTSFYQDYLWVTDFPLAEILLVGVISGQHVKWDVLVKLLLELPECPYIYRAHGICLDESLPSFVQHTPHFLRFIQDLEFPEDCGERLLFTIDVSSLNTSIPHHAALSAIRHYLDQRQDPQIPTITFLRLTELVFTQNCFQFNGHFFHQVKGVAMGTKMGPSVACLTIGYFEEQLFSQYTGAYPFLYKKKRQYSTKILTSALHRIQGINRVEALSKKSDTSTSLRIPLVISHYPSVLPIIRAIYKKVETLRLDPSTRHLFPEPPITVFRVEKNISKHLVRASHPQQPTDSTPGTFPCGRSRCNTCPVVGKNTLIHILGSNGNRFSANQHFTCTPTNLVYILVCGRCNCLYVGETKRRLADRVTEHLRSIKKPSRLSGSHTFQPPITVLN
ncbi:hypothetical protein HOLleu_04364 [Holothuria leucospilota]|uniref:GIY-YIG domain-containing protein n=1 Tax=Holothuria leucospilota TaxID=206669 RepID=A0A9Q1HM97_HOLLE|nr:hypothetical protein HOLleu_04364 [Holothuria leucospilota]